MCSQGSAIMWPSVFVNPAGVRPDDGERSIADLCKKDPRSFHEALPVRAGVKRGANAWLHLYDFRGPHDHSCTG